MGQPFGCLTTRRYDPRVGTFHCTSVYVHSPAAAVIDRAKGKPPDRYGSSATFRAKEATSAFALRVQPVSATPLVVYRLAFGSPRSFAGVD